MKKTQAGISIIENMVAMTVLAIAGFSFLASSVMAITMKRVGIERSAASRAANTAVNPIFYQRGNRNGLISELNAFPKTITEDETHKSYTVSVASMQDHTGSTVTVGSLPTHGVLILTLSVPYSERIGVAGQNNNLTKTLTPSYTLEF